MSSEYTNSSTVISSVQENQRHARVSIEFQQLPRKNTPQAVACDLIEKGDGRLKSLLCVELVALETFLNSRHHDTHLLGKTELGTRELSPLNVRYQSQSETTHDGSRIVSSNDLADEHFFSECDNFDLTMLTPRLHSLLANSLI